MALHTMQCRGLEKALDQIEAERNAKVGEDAAAIAKAAGTEVGARLSRAAVIPIRKTS